MLCTDVLGPLLEHVADRRAEWDACEVGFPFEYVECCPVESECHDLAASVMHGCDCITVGASGRLV